MKFADIEKYHMQMTCDILCIFLYSLSKTLFLKLKTIFNNFTLN